MVTIPKGYVSISLVVPQHIKDALESEIIEKWGYLRRGVIGEIARNALEEYLNKQEYEKTKIIGKKNGLALYNKGNERINTYVTLRDEINNIASGILEYAQKTEVSGSILSLAATTLESIIKTKSGKFDPRTLKINLDKLISYKIMKVSESSMENNKQKPTRYEIDLTQLVGVPALK